MGVLGGSAVAIRQGSPSLFCLGFMSTQRLKFERFREKGGKKELISRHLGFIRHDAKTKFPHCLSENRTDLFELRA